MRDYSNSGLHTPIGVTIKGHHNIVQMETRNEKKDRFEIMEHPQASQGEAATGQAPDLATRYSTLYEKPYVVPFSNISPQMPERAVGVKLGEGTAVTNIRPLTTEPVVSKSLEPSKTDGIDVPTAPQDMTKSFEKTPLPDTTAPTQPIPEPTFGSFETDPLYPAQTPAEYQLSQIKYKEPLSIVVKKKGKKTKWELIDADGAFIKNLNMTTKEDRAIYEKVFGEPYRTGQSPTKGKSPSV
jgi:hypothetical protein